MPAEGGTSVCWFRVVTPHLRRNQGHYQYVYWMFILWAFLWSQNRMYKRNLPGFKWFWCDKMNISISILWRWWKPPVQECRQGWHQSPGVELRGERSLCLATQLSPFFGQIFTTKMLSESHWLFPAGAISGQVVKGDQTPSCFHVCHLGNPSSNKGGR